jgi:hypothetical protein
MGGCLALCAAGGWECASCVAVHGEGVALNITTWQSCLGGVPWLMAWLYAMLQLAVCLVGYLRHLCSRARRKDGAVVP